jgi:NodT family efflux transporter outer membrane factor (OMF) lipoprotein
MKLHQLTALIVVAGCSVGPNFQRPKAPSATQFTSGSQPDKTVAADGVTQRFEVGRNLVADWWRLFQSAQVDAVVSRAILRNPTLEAARASLRRSQNLMRAGYGAFFPQIDAQLGATYQQLSPLRFGQNQPAVDFALFTASATVSYTIDIWGGQRRQVEALGAQVEAQRYTLDGAFVMLCANVVDAMIARAGYQAQMDATRAVVDLEREQVRITEAQATGGTVPYANVLAIRSQTASTEALLPQLQLKIDQSNHLLAALVGEVPSAWSPPTVALDALSLPTDVPVSLPSKLVGQRPDILIAEALLHAANAQIGVATAAMLPNVTLSATGGWNNTGVNTLFDPGGAFWSLGGGLAQPIFHGGTLWHQRKAAIDARDQALFTYEQTVLTAFEQVADSLRALEHDAEIVKAQKEAAVTADEAVHLVEANYRAGIANYLQIIIANEQYLQAKIAYTQAAAQRMQDTVALYVALGGGWWSSPP